ncbi:hypothetical protein AB3S75_006308 [Citrus x aurantiifolia]
MDSSSLTQMLTLPSSLPVILTSLLFFLVLVRHWKVSKGQGNFPPGPKPLPIIGNLHQLARHELPHHAITGLSKQYGPVMKLQLGQVFSVVISSAEAAKEVFKTNELKFTGKPELYVAGILSYDHQSLIFSPYNDYCKQVRKIAALELLSSKRVQSFRSIREEEMWNLVQFISSSQGHAINLGEKFYSMTNDLIARAAFGSKRKDGQNFITVLEETMSLAGGFDIFDVYPSLEFLSSITGVKARVLSIHKKMDKILEEILTEHRLKRNGNHVEADDQEDIVDTLLSYEEDNKNKFHLTINQIKAIILDIFAAGSETSATSIEWAMSEMIKNPGVMKKAQEEVREACKGKSKIEEPDIQNLDYLKAIIKETFRLHPPAPLSFRESIESGEINGYTVPARAKIFINIYAIGRDPAIWEDPESFKPERFEGSSVDFKGNHFELLPFGSGRRICPGIGFATASIELALAQLLYHFDWKLPNGTKLEDLDMTEKFVLAARKKTNLNVIATTIIPFQN